MPTRRAAHPIHLCLLAIALSACGTESLFSGAGCVVGPCTVGVGNGPLTLEAVVGIAPSMLDPTLAPDGRYRARVAVGDTVRLYLVRYQTTGTPCSKADTVRIADWGVTDSTVARAEKIGDGSVRLVARSPGTTGVTALAPPPSSPVNMSTLPSRELVTCGDPAGLVRYLGSIRVVPTLP